MRILSHKRGNPETDVGRSLRPPRHAPTLLVREHPGLGPGHPGLVRGHPRFMGSAEHGAMNQTAMNHKSFRPGPHTPRFCAERKSRPRCVFSYRTRPRKRASLHRVLLHRRGEKVAEGRMRGGYACLRQTAFCIRHHLPDSERRFPGTWHSPIRACERKRRVPLPQSSGAHRPCRSAGESHSGERQPGVGTCRANPRLW